MTQLDPQTDRRPGPNIFDYAAQGVFGFIIPQPQIPGEIRPAGSTAVASRINRPAPEKASWPRWIRCRGRLTLVGGVLTHRGDNDTVIKGELTNSRRAKKMTHEYLVNVKRGRAGDGQLLFIARLFTPQYSDIALKRSAIRYTRDGAVGRRPAATRRGPLRCQSRRWPSAPAQRGDRASARKGAEGDPAAHCLRRLQRVVITDVRNVVAADQQLLAQ